MSGTVVHRIIVEQIGDQFQGRGEVLDPALEVHRIVVEQMGDRFEGRVEVLDPTLAALLTPAQRKALQGIADAAAILAAERAHFAKSRRGQG